VRVLVAGEKGSPTVYDLRVAVKECARRVPPAEPIRRLVGSARRTETRKWVPPAERVGSAGRTHSSVNSAQTLETTTDAVDRPLRDLSDDELRHALLFGPGDARKAIASAEWAERRRKKTSTAVGT
jgi:hypothetical protein